ncbi:succinyl-diaminopimelate desuccinylase [Kangiella profundi]|uniref:Succinyl-diaminopimelate desuccinylase n=1 Tax=Kangiella profundi TaxID=1561924 RepID=A0A2K9ASD1_9GAMM|nr:succinyl-diaminopimelate desuccinylase [Kangiella profundi]AUD79323.1 succinyl-diaminopimelate desuccinylase [Kangiella profundi]GGE99547.1 succinyl-diaminopimelate desuccinylase [Kangiella profundi]
MLKQATVIKDPVTNEHSKIELNYQSIMLELAQNLIRKPSITPSDQGCCDLIGERLQAIGFKLEFMNKNQVSNLWAKKGDGHPVVVFAGHTDVVPPGQNAKWETPAFIPVINDGFLYGRGASDMKGSLAAMVMAVEQFVALYPEHQGSIGFMLTSDEEGIALEGTKHIVDNLLARNELIDCAIVGEPTTEKLLGDAIRIGRRGSINCKITLHGKQGHVGYPEQLINPIHKSSRLIHKLSSKRWDMPSRYFPSTSCQLVKVHSESGAMNVTPTDLALWFNFRYSPRNSFSRIKAYVEKKIIKYGLKADIEWDHEAEPYLTKRGSLRKCVQSVIQKQCGVKPKLTTGGGISDGRFIKQIARQVIELGPSNKTIHQANERVCIAELDQLRQLYFKLLENLLLK